MEGPGGWDLRGHGREHGFYLEPPCMRVLGRPPRLEEMDCRGRESAGLMERIEWMQDILGVGTYRIAERMWEIRG